MKLDDDIHNYYEHLVTDQIVALGLDKSAEADYLADLCCLVLNQLPPKYIRHEVDMSFFLSQKERIEMEKSVKKAVEESMTFLKDKYPNQS